jgi:DinB superfamily
VITTTDLIQGLERNLGIVKAQTQGLSHADSLLQLPFRGNCLNWVLGHIAANRNSMLLLLGEEAIVSEAHAKRYGYGSEPVCGDADDILTLEQLLMVLERGQSALTASLLKITDEELAREVQSFLGTTTLGQLIFFLFWHESYHTGQPEFLRQLAGKDDKVI